MQMFEAFLSSIPASRLELVEELELPDVTLSPYIWEPEQSPPGPSRSDSLATTTTDECDVTTYSTDSSIPLSRAMTDSDIDYDRFRRYQSRSVVGPWEQLRMALDAFPPGYLDSMSSFQASPEPPEEVKPPPARYKKRRLDNELTLKMQKFFEEIQVFAPDDPGLEDLEEAISTVDMKKIIEAEKLDSIKP